MEGVDDHVDITRMDIYPDESFDAFICSHILEHVREDTKAMAELYRILKAGGWGIAMVPLLLGNEETREDPSKTTEAERWRYFCQGDHVRLYARKDFIARLESVGFRVVPLDVHHFGQENFRRHGISLTSVLYIAEKPERGIRTEQG
jgi:ubiquinone/menaquinone biosynthesis C-methylase UbiE